MARSIHTTRRHLKELEREEYADPEIKQERQERFEEELEAKRLIKELSHQPLPPLADGHASPDAVPVHVETEPFLFHPASLEDIRELLGRMPEGIVDGLTAITLSFGKKYLQRDDGGEPWSARDADPITGRPGREVMPGIYVATALGVYSPSKGGVWLTGYVLGPEARRGVAVDMHLRLRALNVFMHELAHHDDHMRRTARGRWCGLSQHNEERYAEAVGHEWTRQYVVPYLQQRYPAEVRELRGFVRTHVGIDISLELLAGDHREHARGGMVRAAGMMPLDRAVDDLFTGVQKGADPVEIRLDFAWALHAAEHYAEAMQIIDDVLSRNPACRAALLHKSHIRSDQDLFAEAAAAAREVLTADADDIDALDCLADACEGLKEWPAVIGLCTRILEISAGESRSFRRTPLSQRARARIASGDLAGAKADIAEIRLGGRPLDERVACRLEKLVTEARA